MDAGKCRRHASNSPARRLLVYEFTRGSDHKRGACLLSRWLDVISLPVSGRRPHRALIVAPSQRRHQDKIGVWAANLPLTRTITPSPTAITLKFRHDRNPFRASSSTENSQVVAAAGREGGTCPVQAPPGLVSRSSSCLPLDCSCFQLHPNGTGLRTSMGEGGRTSTETGRFLSVAMGRDAELRPYRFFGR